jgi:hypothetical protein
VVEEQIKHNAGLVVQQMSRVCGFAFGYDAQSVAWLDGYIERQRAGNDMTPELMNGLVSTLGSYLGECVINCYGGYWENEGGEWRVSFDSQNAVYPFAKVRKQFEGGPGDSIKSFFELIPIVFAPAPRGGARRPWWRFW